jgi:hypothetical protein
MIITLLIYCDILNAQNIQIILKNINNIRDGQQD